ncbi:amidohydrolase [Prauserella sediminis]|uniref:Peptidase M20 domain-containing protein 2 n=1 Tax=Prauserella sediminis TaxID=577680 RepID=A0A839XV72_9PSEU|nr:M20 family metallopeptidase [Prauserella sediminis]MBB3664443.1 amidohydrolase [Prauserella sediminis]
MGTSTDESLRRSVIAAVDDVAARGWELALAIFANPELSGHEQSARASCVAALREAGLEVEDASGVDTGFVATVECAGSGPTVGLLAEYDALPTVGHGCGHHLIAGSTVTAGLGLAAVQAELAGTVKIYGCPSEETLTGKQAMLEAGAFEGVDGVLSFHASDTTSVMTRSTGSREVTFSFEGRPSHAATEPWAGASALDGVLLTMQNVNAFRQLVRDGVRIHGIVTAGGEVHNVIPAFAQCRFGIRSNDVEELDRVVKRVIDCASAGAVASDTRLSIEHGAHADPVRPDPLLTRLMRQNLEALGERVDEWEARASTDFGNVSQVIPGALASVATWPLGTPFHSHDAAKHGDSETAREAMLQGARAMALTTVDYLKHINETPTEEEVHE